jgi:hypothetical protein
VIDGYTDIVLAAYERGWRECQDAAAHVCLSRANTLNSASEANEAHKCASAIRALRPPVNAEPDAGEAKADG